MDTLQEAGTFQNALARKFDKLITPMLSKVIAFVDKYSNLSLLSDSSSEISELWLNMYKSQYFFDILIAHLIGEEITEETAKFKCKFPFSWILHKYVQAIGKGY